MDPSEVAAVKQLSREVLILEMLKSELLDRNARLERWHAEHPRTSISQSGSSQVCTPVLETIVLLLCWKIRRALE